MKNTITLFGLMACLGLIAFLSTSCASLLSSLSSSSSSTTPTPSPVPAAPAFPTSWGTAEELQIGENSKRFDSGQGARLRHQWYYVTVPAGKLSVRPNIYGINFTLYDANQNQLATTDAPTNRRLSITDHELSAGTYYISVGRTQSSGADFRITIEVAE